MIISFSHPTPLFFRTYYSNVLRQITAFASTAAAFTTSHLLLTTATVSFTILLASATAMHKSRTFTIGFVCRRHRQ
jgi:hypothetical protein